MRDKRRVSSSTRPSWSSTLSFTSVFFLSISCSLACSVAMATLDISCSESISSTLLVRSCCSPLPWQLIVLLLLLPWFLIFEIASSDVCLESSSTYIYIYTQMNICLVWVFHIFFGSFCFKALLHLCLTLLLYDENLLFKAIGKSGPILTPITTTTLKNIYMIFLA